MFGQNKQINMKKKNIVITEIIIWLAVLTTSVYFGIYKPSVINSKENSYIFTVKDAGGLVKGSPVKLMGINIGYVKQIKIIDDYVRIIFVVKEEGIKIPNKASATIEFYGLGGSTSLELNPKTSVYSDEEKTILPSGSYRIQDYWDGSKLSSNVMIDMYTSLRIAIDGADLLNNKNIFKQSSAIKKAAEKTNYTNEEQTVIINKLSEMTKEYSVDKKQKTEEYVKNEAINE